MAFPYEFFSVAADTMVLRLRGTRLEVLLIQRGFPPHQGKWALPGGFLERNENALQGARRELQEETGLRVNKLTEFGSFSDVDRDPRGRVVTISFYTLLRNPLSPVLAGDDAAGARWFSTARLPRLAFDHREMIRRGLKAFRRDRKLAS